MYEVLMASGIDPQTAVIGLLSVIQFVGGYVLKEKLNDLNDAQQKVNELELKMASEYVTTKALERFVDRLTNQLDRIETTLATKADKH